MDKGAHFYRCDFQVHSPRDRDWTGNKFGVNADAVETLTADEKKQIIYDRIQFAKEYLEKARNAGLNVIAITDHHDVVSIKTIRKAAEEENATFKAALQFEKVIAVFPGIELTLANPASQCLLIFDADFTDANLDSVVRFLGIAPTNEFEKFTIETQRISQAIINSSFGVENRQI